MADVLDQAEVDALLSAMGSDADVLSAGETASVDLAAPGSVEPRRDVFDYDFKRPERVSKDQMRALEGLHENFARNFGASISSFLRTIIEVQVAGVEQLTFSEFVYSLPNPTCFNLLKAEPLKGQMCLEISPLIIYPIIDRLLGGSSEELFVPQRALTDIEKRLVRRILDRALTAMSDTWSNLIPVKFELTEMESNPHLAQVVAPTETVVIIGFEIKTGQRTGTMSFCIPYNTIEPVVGKLGAQSWLMHQALGDVQGTRDEVIENLRLAKVELRSYLAQTTMSVHDLINLQEGDLIRTDKRVGSEYIVQVEGKNKFATRLGQCRSNRAVCVNRLARPDESL